MESSYKAQTDWRRRYQPIQEMVNDPNQIQMKEQLPEDQINHSEIEGEIIRRNYLSIVDLKNYNTECKEAHYLQINQRIGAVTQGKKIAEETIKRAEMDFMLDLKNLIAQSAKDNELNRVKLALSMAPEHYRPYFENISSKWGY